MSVRITVEVDDDVVEKARLNCIHAGSDFQEFLKEVITKKAEDEVSEKDRVVSISQLSREPWAPSRAMFYLIVDSGEITEGVEGDPKSGHFYKKNGKTYCYYSKLKTFFEARSASKTAGK